MSGILEQMNAKITALEAAVVALKGAISSLGAVTAAPAASPADPFASFGSTPAPAASPASEVPANVTPDMIVALIQPHVDNAVTKAKLSEAMKSLGANALGEIQPHQYAEAYAKFQAVINSDPAPAAAAASII